jgi:hypothetical protein
MRTSMMALFLAVSLVPHFALAQDATPARGERGLYLTVFRSPATGLELRAGHAAAHVGFYPTVIAKNGTRENVNFVRIGATYYVRPRGATAFVTPSVVWSLDDDWKHAALTEIGFRGTLYRGLSGRIGAAVLTTTDGMVRVNPTIGMDIKLGGAR